MLRLGFFLLFFLNIALGTPIKDHSINFQALKELTSYFHISEESNLIEETQKIFIRKTGKERWETDELSIDAKEFVLAWAKREGFFDPWTPTLETYDYGLVLGASTYRMESRLNYLKTLWEKGVRVKEIVFLTGERPLTSQVDCLFEGCENESDAAEFIWKNAPLPDEMKVLPVTFVRVQMKEEQGGLKRPNTDDTLLAWLKSSPGKCTALFVSDQPHCGYQFAIVKKRMPENILFDVVGKGENPYLHPSAAAITLDSIGKWLYVDSL